VGFKSGEQVGLSMEDILVAVPGAMNEVLGFNQGTLVLLISLFALGAVLREITRFTIVKALHKVCDASPVADRTIRQSQKALGTAAGAGLAWKGMEALFALDAALAPAVLVTWLPALAELTMLIALIIWAFRLVGIVHAVVDHWDGDDELDGSEKTLITAVESVLRFLIVVFGAVFLADALHFDLATMVAGLGITGLALALAAKDTISNIFGAVTVLLDRPFRVGDWVIVGGAEGEVSEIGLRTTTLRTSADTVITLPNANLVNEPVENFGKRRWRRYQPMFALDLDSDADAIEGFCEGVLELIVNNELTLKEDASFAHVSAIGPQSIDVAVNMYWDTGSGKVEREAREQFLIAVIRLASELNLEFFEPRVRRQQQE